MRRLPSLKREPRLTAGFSSTLLLVGVLAGLFSILARLLVVLALLTRLLAGLLTLLVLLTGLAALLRLCLVFLAHIKTPKFLNYDLNVHHSNYIINICSHQRHTSVGRIIYLQNAQLFSRSMR